MVTNAREAGASVAFSRRAERSRQPVGRRHRCRVPRRGERGRQGPDRGRHRARRPGRPDLQDPLRVDPGRLRDLVRRSGHGPDLRDLLGRAGRLDPQRLRAPARSSPRRPSTSPASPRSRGDLDEPQPRLVDHRQRDRHPHPARRRHLGRRAREAPYARDPAGPRDPDLHLRHHRAAQGLHAHARQLHVRAGRGRRRAGAALQHRGRRDPALPPARPRVRPDHPGRLHQVPHPARAQRRHQAPAPGPPGVQADLHPGCPPRLREGLQHGVAAGHRRRARQDLRQGRRDRDRLLAGPRQGQARRSPCAPGTPSSSGSSTASCSPRSAASASSRSPAAHPSATGSATSTAASASVSSRATA